MTYPTSFNPLLTRIKEVTEAGLGISNTIPATRFSGEANYPGAENEAVAVDALFRPQILVSVTRISNENRINANAMHSMYDVTFRVEVAYHTDSELIGSARQAIEARLADDVHIIAGALRNPSNLQTTNAGSETGLASGLLDFQEAGTPDYDYSQAVVRSSLTFTGVVVLGYPALS